MHVGVLCVSPVSYRGGFPYVACTTAYRMLLPFPERAK